jgi:hypothetical protein
MLPRSAASSEYHHEADEQKESDEEKDTEPPVSIVVAFVFGQGLRVKKGT